MSDREDISIDDIVKKAEQDDVEIREKQRESRRDPLAEEALRDHFNLHDRKKQDQIQSGKSFELLGPAVKMPRLDSGIMKHIPVGSRNWGITLRYALDQITSGVWKDPMSDAYDFFRYFCGLKPLKAHDFAEEIYDKATRIISSEPERPFRKALLKDRPTDSE